MTGGRLSVNIEIAGELNGIIYIDAGLVGARGFEPPTPCSQGRCASQAALRPEEYILYDNKNKNQTNEGLRGVIRDYGAA